MKKSRLRVQAPVLVHGLGHGMAPIQFQIAHTDDADATEIYWTRNIPCINANVLLWVRGECVEFIIDCD